VVVFDEKAMAELLVEDTVGPVINAASLVSVGEVVGLVQVEVDKAVVDVVEENLMSGV